MKWFATANFVTLLRMIGTLALVFIQPLTPVFLAIYTATGVTDVLDGWIARRTGTASDLGAKLDSCADLLFYGVMFAKLVPSLWAVLPESLWWAVWIVIALRLASYLTAAIKFHTFASLHTYLNKLTGAAVFLIPFCMITSFTVEYCWGACLLAGIASLEEWVMHLMQSDNPTCAKTILLWERNTGEKQDSTKM